MDNSEVLLITSGIAVGGVILSALINFFINHINRSKSLNEWRRDKLMSYATDFLEQFYIDAREAGKTSRDGDLGYYKEIYVSGFFESNSVINKICMLLNRRDANAIMLVFEEMKDDAATHSENNYNDSMNGNYENLYFIKDSGLVFKFTCHISNIIKKMK